MLPGGIRFFASFSNKLLLFLVLLLGVFSLSLYVYLGRDAKEAVLQQVVERKKMLVRSGAASMESFFDQAGKALVVLAHDQNVTSLTPAAQQVMDDFITNWHGTPFIGLGLSDTKGELKYIANRDNAQTGLGVSLADRDYFINASSTTSGMVSFGDPVVSRAGATEGQFILPIATSVHSDDGKINGVLNGTIVLSRLTSQYLDPLKYSPDTQAFLVRSNDSLMLYSDNPDLVGKSIFAAISDSDFLGKDLLVKTMQQAVASKSEGSLRVALPGGDGLFGLSSYIIAWSPVTINGTFLHLVIMTPENSALNFVAPFYIKNVLFVYAGYLLLLIVAVSVSKAVYKRRINK